MGEQGTQSTARLALWLTFAALVLIVIVFRSKITNIEFGSEGVKAHMGMAATTKDVQNMSEEQQKQSQQELAARAQDLKQEAQQEEPDTATVPARNAALRSTVQVPQQQAPQQQPPQFTIPNLAGFWRGSDGIPYRVDQQGSALAITEFDPTGSYTTAYAFGYVTGPTFSMRVATLANTQGVVTLTIANDRQLSGQYVDATTGLTTALQLGR